MGSEREAKARPQIKIRVRPVGGPAAEVVLVPGAKPSSLYLFIGAHRDGPCIGMVDSRELRRMAKAILRELDRKKP